VEGEAFVQRTPFGESRNVVVGQDELLLTNVKSETSVLVRRKLGTRSRYYRAMCVKTYCAVDMGCFLQVGFVEADCKQPPDNFARRVKSVETHKSRVSRIARWGTTCGVFITKWKFANGARKRMCEHGD